MATAGPAARMAARASGRGSRNTAEKRGRMPPAEARHLSKADCPRWRYGDWDCGDCQCEAILSLVRNALVLDLPPEQGDQNDVGRRLATGFPAGSTGDALHHASGRGQGGQRSVLLRDGDG